MKTAKLFKGSPTSVQTLRSGRHVVVCGNFANIYVIDVIHFRVVRTFRSNSLNWHRCGCLFSFSNPDSTLGEGFFSMCMDGEMETYSLRRSTGKAENRSSPVKVDSLKCENALAMCVNPYTHSEILVIMSSEWRLYSMDDLKLLLSVPCGSILGWAGGNFYQHSEVLMWAKDGTAKLYSLPAPLATPANSKFVPRKLTTTSSTASLAAPFCSAEPTVLATFVEADDELDGDPNAGSLLEKGRSPTFEFWRPSRSERQSARLVRTDASGTVTIWRMPMREKLKAGAAPTATVQPTAQIPAVPGPADLASPASLLPSSGALVAPNAAGKLSDHWESVNFMRRLTHDKISSELLCTLTVKDSNNANVVFGVEDGTLVVSSVYNVLNCLFKPPPPTARAEDAGNEAAFSVFEGHTDRVTCLLFPFAHGCAVEQTVFISGSSDYTVRAWDTASKKLLHTFPHHCGEISRLFCPPASSSLLRRGCFCSIALDHSVGVFSLESFSCLYLIGGHSFPIQDVRWRSADDLLIVGCTDGTVNVWQLTTGHLDRTATGQTALDILDSCDDSTTEIPDQENGLGDVGFSLSAVAFGPGDQRSFLLSFDIERMSSTLTRNVPTYRRPSNAHGVEEVPDTLETRLGKMYLSSLLCWGEGHGETLEATMERDLGLLRLAQPVSFSICGEAGRHAFIVPSRDSLRLRWCQSSSTSTTHLLTITALAHCYHRLEVERPRQAMWLRVISWYTTVFGKEHNAGYVKPALLPLAATWGHWQYDIQRVARAHLQSLIHRLDEKGRSNIVSQGISRMPNSAKEHSDDKIAAVVLLGVIAFEHRASLKRENAKLVALALMDIVKSDTAGIKHRAAAAEVLSRAYAAFQPFCDLSAVFEILTELAGTISSARGNPLDAVTTQALINFASTNPQLFVSTVNNQIFLPTFKGQSSVLKVLKALIKKQPMVLSSELPKVVDVVVRCFDPNLPKIRELCFKSAMSVVHEMCPAYPMMSLYRPSARLAVGGADGLINIYDLKSATRWQAIPAHSCPITALAFSHDGKMLASFSIHEKIIRVWHVRCSSRAPCCLARSPQARCYRAVARLAAVSAPLSPLNCADVPGRQLTHPVAPFAPQHRSLAPSSACLGRPRGAPTRLSCLATSTA